MPVVSVIMAVHNGFPFLKEAIVSVLNQSFSDFELIIVDDGSTDISLEIIKEYNRTDSRIRTLQKAHTGLASSLNYGIHQARGKLIARIDADDIWIQNKLEKQINYLNENREVKLLGCSVEFINNSGGFIKTSGFNRGSFMGANSVYNKIVRNNLYCHSSVVFCSDVFKRVKQYDESFVSCMDYDLWIRILAIFPGVILKDKLVLYRISPTMQSVKLRKLQIRESRLVQRNVLRLFGKKQVIIYYYLLGQVELLISVILYTTKSFLKEFC